MLTDDGRAGAVQSVAHVVRRSEFVMEDVHDDGPAFVVVVEIDRVFLAADVLLKDKTAARHHAFIVVLLPVVGVQTDVFQRLLPVVLAEDGVHAHAEKAHGRLEDEGASSVR